SCSIPTDIRNNRFDSPYDLRVPSGMSAWVCVIGYVMKLSTPPKLSAKVNNFNDCKNNSTRASSMISKLTIPLLPGYRTFVTSGCLYTYSVHFLRSCWCLAMRKPNVVIPHIGLQQSKGDNTAPIE